MELKDVYPEMTIKVKMSEGIADAYVINNLPHKKRIALIIKLGTKGVVKYKDWETILDYSSHILKDFELLNVPRKAEGNRAPTHTYKKC